MYHQCGTVKMGPDSDPTATLTPRLKVRGVVGLRVADASIMPTLVGANTHAPCTMIGERAADFILQEYPAGETKKKETNNKQEL